MIISQQEKLENNDIEYEYFDSNKLHDTSSNFRDIDGYFYKNAAVIEPLIICNKIVEGCDS